MILPGLCADILPLLYDEAEFDSVVTDPPYGLKFMGKQWDYGVPNTKTWHEVLRVLKPGGHLLAFGGSRTYHRLACAIEDAGFEIRDQIQWLYGSGFPKSHNLEGDWRGWGTALKPAHEPIVLARKPLVGTVARTVEEYGTGALNIDACRVQVENNLGRWPANVVHDGSDEVLATFPDAPGQQADVSFNAPSEKSRNVYSLRSRGQEPSADRRYVKKGSTNFAATPGARRLDSGSAARFFYCAKASRSEREAGCDGLPERKGGICSETSGQHITRRDGGAPGLVKNNHPTVKPITLMRYLCRLVTPPAGLVLDPFAGSGSTGCGAALEGFGFVGIEKELPFCEIAERRIAYWSMKA